MFEISYESKSDVGKAVDQETPSPLYHPNSCQCPFINYLDFFLCFLTALNAFAVLECIQSFRGIRIREESSTCFL